MIKNKSRWEQYIVWFITIASTGVLITIGNFLINNIEWFKQSLFDKKANAFDGPQYRIYAYHLYLSIIKRSIGFFSGFAIMFLGMAVSFYSMKEKTTGEVKTSSITTAITTSSPGIIAQIIGGILIILTIQSKDEFPPYDYTEKVNQPGDPYIPPIPN